MLMLKLRREAIEPAPRFAYRHINSILENASMKTRAAVAVRAKTPSKSSSLISKAPRPASAGRDHGHGRLPHRCLYLDGFDTRAFPRACWAMKAQASVREVGAGVTFGEAR